MSQLVIRADAGKSLGLGHLLRSVALAEEAVARGVEVTFRTTPGEPRRLLRERGFESSAVEFASPGLEGLEPETTIFIDGDHFGLDVTEAARDRGGIVGLITDRPGGVFDVDVLVSPDSWDTNCTTSDRGVVLAGPEYALVRAEFRRRRRQREASTNRGVVVSLGGSDPWEMSAAVASSVRAAIDVPVRLLLGPMSSVATVPGVERVIGQREPSIVFDDADCVVAAAGSTAWELLAMGQRCVLLPLTEEHERACRVIEQADAAVVIWEPANAIERVGEQVRRVLSGDSGRALSSAALALADGLGAARVFDAMDARSR